MWWYQILWDRIVESEAMLCRCGTRCHVIPTEFTLFSSVMPGCKGSHSNQFGISGGPDIWIQINWMEPFQVFFDWSWTLQVTAFFDSFVNFSGNNAVDLNETVNAFSFYSFPSLLYRVCYACKWPESQKGQSLPPKKLLSPSPIYNAAPDVPETLCQQSCLKFCDFLTLHYVTIRLWE